MSGLGDCMGCSAHVSYVPQEEASAYTPAELRWVHHRVRIHLYVRHPHRSRAPDFQSNDAVDAFCNDGGAELQNAYQTVAPTQRVLYLMRRTSLGAHEYMGRCHARHTG